MKSMSRTIFARRVNYLTSTIVKEIVKGLNEILHQQVFLHWEVSTTCFFFFFANVYGKQFFLEKCACQRKIVKCKLALHDNE